MRKSRHSAVRHLITYTLLLLTGGLVVEALAIVYVWRRVEHLESSIRDTRAAAIATKKAAPVRREVAQRITYEGTTFDTFAVDVQSADVAFYFRDSSNRRLERLSNLRQYLRSRHRDVVFATNGGMFTPSGEPLGLYIEKGRELYPLNLRSGAGNFYLKPNGVFMISDRGAYIVDSKKYNALVAFTNVLHATQSGPLLVQNSAIHPSLGRSSESKYIRSGVGIITPTNIIFAISDEPVTFYTFASLFKERLHCQDALYLDGAISKMYLPALNRQDLDGDFGAMIAVTRALE